MHKEMALTGGAAHQVVEQGHYGAEVNACPALKETPRTNKSIFALFRWTLMTEGSTQVCTATSEAMIVGVAGWDVRVNLPEQRNPKNTRQDVAHSRPASYWSPPATDHEERRCHMTEAVIGRHWLLARDWEHWIPRNMYGRRVAYGAILDREPRTHLEVSDGNKVGLD